MGLLLLYVHPTSSEGDIDTEIETDRGRGVVRVFPYKKHKRSTRCLALAPEEGTPRPIRVALSAPTTALSKPVRRRSRKSLKLEPTVVDEPPKRLETRWGCWMLSSKCLICLGDSLR